MESRAVEHCPLFDLVDGLDGPRDRAELASIVVKWITGWGPDGWTAGIENVPGDLFREDEVEVVSSLTSWELAIAAGLMFAEAADFIERRYGPGTKADGLRRTSAFLTRGIASYLRGRDAGREAGRYYRGPSRNAPRSRRSRSTQRARSPGRQDPDLTSRRSVA